MSLSPRLNNLPTYIRSRRTMYAICYRLNVKTQPESIHEPGSGFSPDAKPTGTLIGDSPASGTVRKKIFWFVSYPAYDIGSPSRLRPDCFMNCQIYINGITLYAACNGHFSLNIVFFRYTCILHRTSTLYSSVHSIIDGHLLGVCLSSRLCIQ